MPFDYAIHGISRCGEDFWLLPQRGNEVILWNYEKDECKRIPVIDELPECPFCGVEKIGSDVVLLPMYAKSAYLWNQQMECFVSTGERITGLNGSANEIKLGCYFFVEKYGVGIGLKEKDDKQMFIISDGRVKIISMDYPEVEQIALQSNYYKQHPTLSEGNRLSIFGVISHLAKLGGACAGEEAIGRDVYETVIKLV